MPTCHAFRTVLPMLLLGACAAPLPAPAPLPVPTVAAAPSPVRTARAVKPKRSNTCRPAVLSAERKQELFRQFAATNTGNGTPEPAPTPPCRQAAR